MTAPKKKSDHIDPVTVLYRGEYVEMNLADAVELDVPEGTVTIEVSATLLDMLVQR